MFVLRLLSVVVKLGLAAAVVVGGVYVYQNWESWGTAEPGSGTAAIDYNCGLAGSGFPWLEQERGRDNWHGDLDAPFHLGGIFGSTVPSTTGDPRYGVALPVRIREDGIPSSMADVYRMLCAVHPDLGGSGLRPLTPEEKRTLDFGDASGAPDTWDAGQIPDLYTDGVIRAADEAHIGWEQIRVYLLPPIPRDLLDALATREASQQTSSTTPSPRPSPTATPETRTYAVTVTGYENVDKTRPDDANASVTATARFSYQLSGKFTIAKNRNGAWKLASAGITSADVQVGVSLSPAECWSQTRQTTRYFVRLRQKKDLGGLVNSHGDGSWEVQLMWGHLRPGVRVDAAVSADAQCGGSGHSVPYDFESQLFFNWLNDELLEIQGKDRLETSGGVTADGKRRVDYRITVVRLKP